MLTEVVRIAAAPRDEGRLVEVGFGVSSELARLEVELVVEDADAVVDLGLADPHRVRGWSGGARRRIELTPAGATPGYLAGSLPAGRWAVLLGWYAIPRSLEAEVRIRREPWRNRWVPMDLHVHSEHSDGALPVGELAARARALGLEAIALTDHNTSSQNRLRRGVGGVDGPLLCPGMEWTTRWGHAGLLGLDDPLPDWRAEGPAQALARLQEARAQGAFVVANHPADRFAAGLAWTLGFEAVDGVEVWNGPWRAASEEGLAAAWQRVLAGQHLVFVGGSDWHRDDPFVALGSPTTWVWAEAPGLEGLLAGLRRGEVVLGRSPLGPRPLGATSVPGEREGGSIVVALEGCEPGDELVVVEGNEASSVAVATSDRLEVELDAHQRWVRWELRRREPLFGVPLVVAASSPILLGR